MATIWRLRLPASQPRTSKRSDMWPCHSCGRILTNLADVIGGISWFVTTVFISLFAVKISDKKENELIADNTLFLINIISIMSEYICFVYLPFLLHLCR